MNLVAAAQNGIRDLEKNIRSARSVSLQLRYRANRLRNGIGEYGITVFVIRLGK